MADVNDTGGVWSQSGRGWRGGVKKYTYSGDDSAWLSVQNKLDRDFMVSKNSKKIQKKYGYDPANRAKLLAQKAELEERGINESSIKLRKYESKLKMGWGDHITESMASRLRKKLGKDDVDDSSMRTANAKAQAAPIPHPAVASAAPTIKTPEETVARTAVPNVSRRIKQKTANVRAGIRT